MQFALGEIWEEGRCHFFSLARVGVFGKLVFYFVEAYGFKCMVPLNEQENPRAGTLGFSLSNGHIASFLNYLHSMPIMLESQKVVLPNAAIIE